MTLKIHGPNRSINNLIKFIDVFLEMAEELFEENESLKFIAQGRFNQDVLENNFGVMRSRGGHNTNPSVREFCIAESNISSMTMVKDKCTILTNCEVYISKVEEVSDLSDYSYLLLHR